MRKAVILAGGLGSRLRPFTEAIPKPLLPIGEKSVLEIQIGNLRKFGFDARKPRGSFFLYVRAPRAVTSAEGTRQEFTSAEEVSQWLITEKSISILASTGVTDVTTVVRR